jgi:hypothetical protein
VKKDSQYADRSLGFAPQQQFGPAISEAAEPRCATVSGIKPPDTSRWSEARPRFDTHRIKSRSFVPKSTWDSFLIIKVIRQIPEARMPLILVRKHHGPGFDRPVYTKVRVTPQHTRIMTRAVIGSDFIENLRLVFERAKTMKKARRHP